MGERSVASAVISFGLVAIPVKFYLTAQAKSVAFNMVTPAGNRVRQKLVDSITNEDVEYSACSKGFEHVKDQFVIFTKEELKALGESDNGTMEVKEFIPLTELRHSAVEKSYYLDANKGGDRAYRLFAAALREGGVAAVAQWVSRGRQHLVVVAEDKGVLIAYQMFYHNELRNVEIDCATYTPSEAELLLAGKLINAQKSDSFDMTKYHDSYRERVEEAIAKRNGTSVGSAPSANASPQSDLFAALQASLNQQTPGAKVDGEVVVPIQEKPKATKKNKKSA